MPGYDIHRLIPPAADLVPEPDTYLAHLDMNCVLRGVGAVIVRDKHVLATGYNGPPSGSVHCDVVSCIRFTTYTINDVITDVIQCSSSVFFMFFFEQSYNVFRSHSELSCHKFALKQHEL